MKSLEKEILEEIIRECKWWERIIVKAFSRIVVKTYKIGSTKGFNLSNQ